MRPCARRRPSTGRGEEGVALFYALLVTLIVGGIVAVVFLTATGESRQAAFEVDFENTVHLAEAGVEVVLQELDGDQSYITTDYDGDVITGPLSTQTSYEWAIEVATEPNASSPDGYNLPAMPFGAGEAVAIRPAGSDADYAYGIGFEPSRAAWDADNSAGYVRVVRTKLGFTDDTVIGEFAILSGDLLTNETNAYAIDPGSLHTNGDLSISQNNVPNGTISFTGDCLEENNNVCPEDDSSVSGPVAENPIPTVTLDSLWWAFPEAFSLAESGQWLDYCDGTGEYTPTLGTGWYERGEGDAEPCTGNKLSAAPAGWSSGATLSYSNVTDPNTVFWVDSASSVSVSKIQDRMSVLSRGPLSLGPSGSTSGMEAVYPGLLAFSEGNVDVSGNLTVDDPDGAMVYSGGDMQFDSSLDATGLAFVVKGVADIRGSATIRYDGNAETNLGVGGDPLVLEWEELHEP